jgi:hypothetical protein
MFVWVGCCAEETIWPCTAADNQSINFIFELFATITNDSDQTNIGDDTLFNELTEGSFTRARFDLLGSKLRDKLLIEQFFLL